MAILINTDGSGFQQLHAFASFNGDGSNPCGGLIQGQDNLLYGTTNAGGANGSGTVYSLKTNGGPYSVVFDFGSSTDFAFAPYGGVIQGPDGTHYGTTRHGGTNGSGTVFRVSTNGSSFKALHDLVYNTDGGNPPCSRLMAGEGYLYGMANCGGTNAYGTLFRLDVNGATFSVLHSFAISE